MLTVFILGADGRVTTESDAKTLAAAMRDHKATFWVDMDQPTDEEYGLLDEVFGFHPLAIEDTIQYQQRPKIENYNHLGDACDTGYFYMVIHGPDLKTFRENVRTKELDIFVSERYLLTIHDEPMASIDEVMKRMRGDPRRALEHGIDVLLHSILDRLVDHYQPILEHLQESIEKLEDDALSKPSPTLLSQLSRERRELLALRRVIGPQRDVIAQLSRGEVPFIRESTRVYFRDVQDHLARAVEMIELYRELIASARDLYLSSVNNSLNQIMKTLTIVTAVTAVLNVVTGFFGMNFDYLPGLHSHGALVATVSIMFALAVGSVGLFWWKKWL
jgi:magnesium transporter